MGYIGQAPTKVPLTSSDITDGTIALADMAANSVDSPQYVDGSVDAVHLSANSVDSDSYVDASIDNAHLADDAVGVAELSATGTASSSTFLRGDNAWAAAGGGIIVQVVKTQSSSMITGTTQFPLDDTIPTNTEGFTYAALDTAITPTNALNILRIEAFVQTNMAISVITKLALYQDSGACISITPMSGGGGHYTPILLNYYMVAGSTSARTYKLRVGPHSATTITINGRTGVRDYGGTMISHITITEIEV